MVKKCDSFHHEAETAVKPKNSRTKSGYIRIICIVTNNIMRLTALFTFFIAMASAVHGQASIDCSPVEMQKLDSVINYLRVGQTDTYNPVEIFIYHFDGVSEYPVIDKLTLPSREPVNRQNYLFYEPSFKVNYILQEWDGNEFHDRSRTDYYYRPDRRLEKEVFSGFDGSLWIPYQQHIYNYDEQNIIRTYLRQMMYTPGVWTDFSYKNYIYDSQGRLTERNEQRIADGVIFWAELFTYDQSERVDTRIRQTLKYNPQTRTNELTNLNRQRYSYNKFGNLSTYLTDTWTNGSWALTGKSIYYRSWIFDKDVPICFRGHTMIVSVKVAVRLINIGAVPGRCECLTDGQDDGNNGRGNGRGRNNGLVVYPNPALASVTVLMPDGASAYDDISIYDHNGTLVRRYSAGSKSEDLDVSSLGAGTYYIVVNIEGESLMTSFIKAR